MRKQRLRTACGRSPVISDSHPLISQDPEQTLRKISFFKRLSYWFFGAAVGLASAGTSVVNAQTYTYSIDSNRTATVTLPAGGGTAHVEPGITINPPSGNAIDGQTGDVWTITNDGGISSSAVGINLPGSGSSVINNASISSTSYAINGQTSLSVTNGANGTIQSTSSAIGMAAGGKTLNVDNSGVIFGFNAVFGSLDNTSGVARINNSNLIQGNTANSPAISLTSGTNPLQAEGTIDNLTGGQILGGSSVCAISTLHVWTTLNNRAGATVQGSRGFCGTDLYSIILTNNSGSIIGTGNAGIYLYGGGDVTNLSGGLIRGLSGVSFIRSTSYTENLVNNSGSIVGTGTTLILGTGADAGSGVGVYIGGTHASYPIKVANQPGGTIGGGVYGIYSGNGSDDGPTIIRNAGTITAGNSGVAIRFPQIASRTINNSLILDAGSLINGSVLGRTGPGIDTLILTGSGSEDVARFTSFEDLQVDVSDNGGAASFWTLNNNASFSRATTLIDGTLRINGALTSPVVNINTNGTLAGAGAINANVINKGTIAPSAGQSTGNFITLPINGNYSSDGTGTLKLNIQLGDSASPGDRLMINGNVSGSTLLDVRNAGGTGALTSGFGILVAKNVNGNAPDAGLILNAPLQAGQYLYSLVQVDNLVADGGGASWYLRSVFNPVTAIEVFPETLPDGIVDSPYSQTLSAENGVAPYTFRITAGSLPPSLALNSDGLLHGTPTVAGISVFTVTATDRNGRTGYRIYTLHIGLTPRPEPPPPDPNKTHADVEHVTRNAETITGVFVPEDNNREAQGAVFVFAYLPTSVTFAPDTLWVFDSGLNWHLFNGDCRITPAYFTGSLQVIDQIPIVSMPTDTSIYAGGELYIGYGLGGYAQPSGQACNDMIVRRNWVKVYTEPFVSRGVTQPPPAGLGENHYLSR